ncbi:hypothetical protein H0H81_001779, partial [Sphagnurus paluster]
GRLTNLNDIPLHGSFFFVEPDYTADKAQVMLKRITPEQQKLLDAVAATEPWDGLDILGLLHMERERLGVPYKVFMTVLRHALCGQKDGPAVADVMRVLGRERTLARLRGALPAERKTSRAESHGVD